MILLLNVLKYFFKVKIWRHRNLNYYLGGEIVFRGDSGRELDLSLHEHSLGEGLLHRGRHLHKALSIDSGERWNLIIWMRSSKLRNLKCPMCQQAPNKISSPYYGDGFTL